MSIYIYIVFLLVLYLGGLLFGKLGGFCFISMSAKSTLLTSYRPIVCQSILRSALSHILKGQPRACRPLASNHVGGQAV